MAPETEPVDVPSADGQKLPSVLPADIRKGPHPTLVRGGSTVHLDSHYPFARILVPFVKNVIRDIVS